MKNFRVILMLITGIIVIVSTAASGQSNSSTAAEGFATKPETIEFSEIPIRSVEVLNQTRQYFHDLIPANTIALIRQKNNRLISSIDTTLLVPVNAGDPTINFRYLENRKMMLLKEKERIDEEEMGLREVIGTLDKLSSWLTTQSAQWRETQKLITADTLMTTIPQKVTRTINILDSSIRVLARKSSAMMGILEQTIAIGIRIDLTLEKTQTMIVEKQRSSFSVDHPPLFQLNLTQGYRKAVNDSFKTMGEVKLVALAEYLQQETPTVLFITLLFGLMAWFFHFLRRRIHVVFEGSGRFYKKMMLVLLSRPYSAAVIMVFLAFTILLPGRPIIIREFSTYLLAYPLLALVDTILQKQFKIYLYIFSVIVVVYILLLMIASETAVYRLLLLVIAMAEIGLLGLLLLRFRKKNAFNMTVNRFILFFVVIHLGLAITGLVANISGRVLMTEMVLNAVFNNILSGVILFILVILVNGLISMTIDSPQGRSLNTLRMHGEQIKQGAIRTFNILALLIWVSLILRSFHLNDMVFKIFAAILTHKFSLGSASFSLDLVVIFFVVIYASLLLARFLKVILEEDVLIRMPLSKGLPHTIAMGVKYAVIVGGFLLAINAAGIPVDKVTIILGAFSVGIGFGLQNIFSNMVSGLILLFERPIQIGDTVQVGQLTGNVKSIDLRSSNVQTFDGAEVIVPNGQLVTSEVINWTLSDKKRRLEIPVGVAYDSDPPRVHKLLIEILHAHSEVLKDPEPLVYFSGLGDSSLDFFLVFWIGNYVEGRRIKSEVLFTIFEVLKENEISIPFPQRDVHVRMVNGSTPK